MGDCCKLKIGDIISLEYGKGLQDYRSGKGKYDVFGTNGKIGLSDEFIYDEPSIIIGRKGAYREVHLANRPFFVIDTAFYTKRKIKDLDNLYLYFWFKNIDINEMDSGSAIPSTSRGEVCDLDINLPPVPEQKAIASVLSSLDDKIDLLHRQNKTLESMAKTLFRQWFVEEAQEDWEEVLLGNFFPVVTGKKDANYSTEGGKYPFFTCSQGILKASGYSFEGKAILLAGNGDFNVKRCDGKFEAYQRTYVLMPFQAKYFNFLFVLIKYFLAEITGGHQGSVINFITKGMITDFKFQIPINDFQDKLTIFDSIYNKIDFNNAQIRILEKLRDKLLPKLMSGGVRVEYNEK